MTNQNKKPYNLEIAHARQDQLMAAFRWDEAKADAKREAGDEWASVSLWGCERLCLAKTLKAAMNISVMSFCHRDHECHKWINRKIGWLVREAEFLLGFPARDRIGRPTGTKTGKRIHPDTLEKWHVEIRHHEWADGRTS